MDSPELKWVRVAANSDVREGTVLAVDIGEYVIAIYRVEGGELYATDNICTHAMAFLSDGILDGYFIECPLHAGCFDVRTGKGQGDPIEQDLPVFPVRVVGDDIEVGLPA